MITLLQAANKAMLRDVSCGVRMCEWSSRIERMLLTLVESVAKASTTEEPVVRQSDAGKLHARFCGGAPGNGCSYSVMQKYVS